MAQGLSDRDRRRLEEGRRWAAEKLAEERERLAKEAELLAERAARADEERQARQARYGPKEVAGPDGVVVQLTAMRSGPDASIQTPGEDPVGCLIFLPILAAVSLVNLVVFRGGWTLQVEVPGQKKIKIRSRSKDAAAEHLQRVANAIERYGIAAVSQPAIRRP